ncbi:bile acid:sodium symporter family protein [Govanella unica]|uniref:Bile acid:sodium symporter family protein n=1 Tax=Govanella unica TaxID=2975056 RepID=A0A9X3Z7H9_9PROT|nr:bile acid:sodium symporter family protein [Govania unica]
MSDQQLQIINFMVVPFGLMAIMVSLGLSLTVGDFRRLLDNPRPVTVGLGGQLILMPALGWCVAYLFRLPPELAVGLFILACSPAGVTSNALTYAARANIALAVTLTALSSVITVFTTPFFVQWALNHYYAAGSVPEMSIWTTVLQLVKVAVLPVAVGMIIRHFLPGWAARAGVWLRPASMIILIFVIVFSLLANAQLVWNSLLTAGPAAWVLNVLAMATGLGIATLAGLNREDRLTVAIEVGVHNATLATFVTMSVLGSLELAITPTIYGAIMVINASILIRYLRRRARKAALAE